MALTASPTDQALLLDLQALDTKLQQLDHRARSLPQLAVLATLAAEATSLRGVHSTAFGAVEDAQLELRRIESDVALVEARIIRDSERLQNSSSVKDVAGLESELAGLQRRRDELEEIELVVMERLEGLEATATGLKAEIDAMAGRVAAAGAERDEAAAAIAEERASAAANRDAVAAGIPADLLALYERQRARYGTGASHLRGGVSSASGVRLLENELAKIRAASPDAVLMCPDSEAILVRTAESGLDKPAGPRFE